MKYSFVIPCYRSENTIDIVVKELTNKLNQININDYEIILVNDCSPDKVWEKIVSLTCADNHICGINLAKNFGQHAALLAGYSKTRGEYVISLDDDGQTPIDELDKLISKIEEGYDVVYSYYDVIKQKKYRKLGTWIAAKMAQIMLGAPKDFKGSSFYIAKRLVIDEIVKYDNPYPYLLGLTLRVTRKIGYVEVHHRNRLEGTSGYTFKSLVSLWLSGFTAFSVKPLEAGMIIGFIFSFIGFIVGIFTIIRKLLNPAIMAGWSSMISVMLFISGIVMLMLGLIGEYIGRIYICINHAPQYVIREEIINNSFEK